MTENRLERVVRMAAAFPWHDYNSARPIGVDEVGLRFGHELTKLTDISAHYTVAEVVKLVNSRPADDEGRGDPFKGIA